MFSIDAVRLMEFCHIVFRDVHGLNVPRISTRTPNLPYWLFFKRSKKRAAKAAHATVGLNLKIHVVPNTWGTQTSLSIRKAVNSMEVKKFSEVGGMGQT